MIMNSRRRGWVAIIILFCALTAFPRAGQSAKKLGAFSLSLGAGTVFPVNFEASIGLRVYKYFGLELGMGTMPPFYVSTINAIATAAGWYNDTTARILSQSLRWPMTVRVRLIGYPLAGLKLGLYIHLDYVLAALGGGISSSSYFSEATGENFADAGKEIPVSSTLHNLSAGVGWLFELPRDFQLGLELSFFGCLNASSKVTVTSQRGRALTALSRAGEAYLNDVYTSYVLLPVFNIYFRYRFF